MSNLDSEIVNQKKQFIFDVEAVSDHLFPYEVTKFYIYIKNISGAVIEHLKIKIEKDEGFYFDYDLDLPDQEITLQPNQVQLYDMEGYARSIGDFYIHFIAYGDGTELHYEKIKIKCNRTYNSDKLIHKIHIYDFTPYESKFTLEANDYSEEVTQILKRQKLPYKAGEQPFPMDKNFIKENKESQSYLDQYAEIKNHPEEHKEHSYQYLSREQFTKDSLESYTGKNLYEIIKDINENSEYFKATFLRTGNNHLLTDFTQYKPNGFIYRMGLLSSEIYHALGVIPTFDYMSDYLFRWAPSPTGQHLRYNGDEINATTLLNLYPEQKSMKWDENVWAGSGWIVYKIPTDEYINTEEFKEKLEDKLISYRENVGFFEELKKAEEFVKVQEYYANKIRNYQKDDLVKFRYEIQESIYETGVFFINIPINKIPKNFYLIETEDLYAIVNRVKPFGMKPIINYIIETEFDCRIKQNVIIDYEKYFEIPVKAPRMTYDIYENRIIDKEEECGDQTVQYKSSEIVNYIRFNDDFNAHVDIETENQHEFYSNFDAHIEQDQSVYTAKLDQSFVTLGNIVELLYHNNYNNISFYTKASDYQFIRSLESKSLVEDEFGNYTITGVGGNIDGIKLPIPPSNSFGLGEESIAVSVTDILENEHILKTRFDVHENLYYFDYIFKNRSGKSYQIKRGYQDIRSIGLFFLPYDGRRILIFAVEDNKNRMHYFYHTIVQGLTAINTYRNDEETNVGAYFKRNSLEEDVTFETPFCYVYEAHSPCVIEGKDSWTDLFRIDSEGQKSASFYNNSNSYSTVDDIKLFYDDISIPETGIIKTIRLKINGDAAKDHQVYVSQSISNNYRTQNVDGLSLQLRPDTIEVYEQTKESNMYYVYRLQSALEKGQVGYIDKLQKLINDNIIFNEKMKLSVDKYLEAPNDFITISDPYWYEISDFSDAEYNLNNMNKMYLVLEGYNDGEEIRLLASSESEMNISKETDAIIPAGYFYKKIPLYYPNSFLLNSLRVRFRFQQLTHDIKIFNTSLQIDFRNKESDAYGYNLIDSKNLKGEHIINLLKDYIYPVDVNNGLALDFSFDDIKPGGIYSINSIQLEIIYQDTDMDLMINKNKYKYVPNEGTFTSIQGTIEDAYFSGLFYNDVATVIQLEDNIGFSNNGIKLYDSLYQSFEARSDNITSIEIFPHGFVGNPDENIKISLYTNHENTPYKLIKEIYARGWTKNNKELKGLESIKYNINVDGLEENKRYWFKIEVLDPREGSYYLLKSVTKTLPRYKLLSVENNNYINTFNTLTFNIYSQNLSKSFKDIPFIQEFFNNPYILFGLHKGQGTVKGLLIDKFESDISGEDQMTDYLDVKIEESVNIIIKTNDNGTLKYLKTNELGNKWVNSTEEEWNDINGEE